MNFNDHDFDAFERDLKRATEELCRKYEVKITKTRISYSEMDFDLKITFEKHEEGVNTERFKFIQECEYYGFTPEDYMRTFTLRDGEFELIGFDRSARKYNCRIRNVETGELRRANNLAIQQSWERELQKAQENYRKEQEEKLRQAREENIRKNVLTKADLDTLKMKQGKSKLTMRDIEQIKAILAGKSMYTYCPKKEAYHVSSIDGLALEQDRIMAFFSKEALDRHIGILAGSKIIPPLVDMIMVPFEELLRFADDHQKVIIWEVEGFLQKGRKYYRYIPADKEISCAVI